MSLFALAVVSLCAVVGCWLAYRLLPQNGRARLRPDAGALAVASLALEPGGIGGSSETDSIEADAQQTEDAPRQRHRTRGGLPPGTPAPDFRVRCVTGGELSLSKFRGRPLLLMFSDPDCAPCDALVPELERRFRAGDVSIVMVSRGDWSANLAKIAHHHLTFPVGLQRHQEVSRDYAVFAAPVGYWIDEEGNVAAPPAIGPDAILALLSQAGSQCGTLAEASSGTYQGFLQ
jgi:peroxiredoxin